MCFNTNKKISCSAYERLRDNFFFLALLKQKKNMICKINKKENANEYKIQKKKKSICVFDEKKH
jgi:hypothetical protein